MGTYDEYGYRPCKMEWTYEWVPATNNNPRGLSPTMVAYDDYHETEDWDLMAILDNLKELRQEMPSDEWDNEENN